MAVLLVVLLVMVATGGDSSGGVPSTVAVSQAATVGLAPVPPPAPPCPAGYVGYGTSCYFFYTKRKPGMELGISVSNMGVH